jgi:hypothetical protein
VDFARDDEVYTYAVDTPAKKSRNDGTPEPMDQTRGSRTEGNEATPPKYLTEEEKRLSLGELAVQWRKASLLQQLEKNNQRSYDLGWMTEQQKEYPRAEIRRIISERKHDNWIQAMKRRNVPLRFCDVCQQLVTDPHQCMRTKWAIDTPRGKGSAAVKKEVIVTESGQGVHVRQQQRVDAEQLEREYTKIRALKKQVDEKSVKIREALGKSIEDAWDDEETPTPMDAQQEASENLVTYLSAPSFTACGPQ